MAKYTTEVRSICEVKAGLEESADGDKVNEVIEASWDKIFDSTFPIFDEEYRPVLCKKILKYFYTREIGYETAGLWKLKLNTKMEVIMPYYNQLYESEKIEFNPLGDVNYKLTSKRDGKGTGKEQGETSGTGTSDDWSMYQDTPQGGLTGVRAETYLTNARHDTGNSGTTGKDKRENEFSNTDEYVEEVVGKRYGGSNAKYLMEYRDSLMNIDRMIIEELEPLFMGLW